MEKAKLTKELLKAVQAAEQNEKKYTALKAAAFDSADDYTTYCYDVSILSDRLYIYQTTHGGKEAVTMQIQYILSNYFEVTEEQTKLFTDTVLRGGLITAVKPSQNLVEEDAFTRLTLQEKIKAVEEKPLDENYTATRRSEVIEEARQNLREFMKTARYESTIASPTRYNPFRRRFEEVLGKTLNDSLKVKAALHAANLDKYRDMYGRWSAAACMYGIDPRPYIEAEDIHGLKAAVRVAKEGGFIIREGKKDEK